MNNTCTLASSSEAATAMMWPIRQRLFGLLAAITSSNSYGWVLELLFFLFEVKAYQAFNEHVRFGNLHWLSRLLGPDGVKLRVNSTDATYEWITAWMTSSPEWRSQTEFELSSDKSGRGSPPNFISYRMDGKPVSPDDRAKDSEANYNPTCGVEYVFQYERYKVTIKREVVGKGSPNDRTAYFICIKRGGYHTRDQFVASAKDVYLKQLKGVVAIYQAGLNDMGWTYLRSNERRSLDTVHLDGNKKEELLEDLQNFLSERTKVMYRERGIPYRRGYLLYGPPGTGKSTIVTALAGHLGLKVHVLQLSSTMINDAQLNMLMAALPERCIVLLEDIDKTFSKATTVTQGQSEAKGVTLGGLLNVMDGLCAADDGRLLLVTTNNKDILDEAVTRPGRLHVHMEFGYATADMARKYFMKYFSIGTSVSSEVIELLSERFSEQLREGFSMAKLEEYLWTHDSSPDEAVAHFTEWQEEQMRDKTTAPQSRK